MVKWSNTASARKKLGVRVRPEVSLFVDVLLTFCLEREFLLITFSFYNNQELKRFTTETMTSIGQNCAGCRRTIQTKEMLICHTCKRKYDIICANISEKQFRSMTPERKLLWNCQQCHSRQPKGDSTNSPISRSGSILVDHTQHADDNHLNVTKRKKGVSPPLSMPGCSYIPDDQMQQLIKELSSSVETKIKELVTEELKNIKTQLCEFQSSLSFFNIQFEEMRSSLNEKDALIRKLQNDNENLQSTFKDYANRLCLIEQNLRQSNLEINGVPEHRTENIITAVYQLAKTVGEPLADSDIVQATRVAKVNKDNNRPRAIVVKLRTPRVRDSLLAAVSRFNKKQPLDKLSSQHLGISGDRKPVYVSEHLCPASKQLHAATRQTAKDLSYKYVWVRNGRIFVRKDELSPALLVRSQEFLLQLKNKKT